jgi:hypothetical protein
MATNDHNKAAELHESAAKSHRAAAEQHGKGIPGPSCTSGRWSKVILTGMR